MALLPVKDVQLWVKSTHVTAFIAALQITDDKAKTMLDPIKRMTTIVDTTGIGDQRRQRRDAGLQDLADVTISGLLDPADNDGLYALLVGSFGVGEFELDVRYSGSSTNNNIKANWLVAELESDHKVGDLVMVKAKLQAEGSGFDSNL